MNIRIVVLLLFAGVTVAGAQDRVATDPGFCIRGRPLASCQSYLVFDLTLNGIVSTTSQLVRFGNAMVQSQRAESDFNNFLGWTVGAMHNTDSTHALGGAIQVGGFSSTSRVGLVGRRRTFLSTGATLDLSAGPIFVRQAAGNGIGEISAFGITAEAAVGLGDLAGLTAGVDAARSHARGSAAFYVGVRLGSYAALGATALVAAAHALASREID
jgi:hypothetical protein